VNQLLRAVSPDPSQGKGLGHTAQMEFQFLYATGDPYVRYAREARPYELAANIYRIHYWNPLAPVIRAELPIISGLLSLAVEGLLAFVKRYLGYIYCIDVSNPSSPYIQSTIRETSTQWGKLTISNRNLYIGDQNGFTEHVDVSNPDSARVTILYNVAFTVTAAYAKDTLLFLGNGSNRLYIYSITMPTSPVQLSNASIGIAGIVSITLPGDTAFVGTIDGPLVAVSVTDRRNPVVLGTYTPPVFQPGLLASYLVAQNTALYCSLPMKGGGS
jgi:hypothetical protein